MCWHCRRCPGTTPSSEMIERMEVMARTIDNEVKTNLGGRSFEAQSSRQICLEQRQTRQSRLQRESARALQLGPEQVGAKKRIKAL